MQPNASTGWPRGVLTGPGLTRVVRLNGRRPLPSGWAPGDPATAHPAPIDPVRECEAMSRYGRVVRIGGAEPVHVPDDTEDQCMA